MHHEDMQQAFFQQLRDQRARLRNAKGTARVGLEMEFFTMQDGEPVPSTPLHRIPGVKPELGLQQVEVVTRPVDGAEPGALEREVHRALDFVCARAPATMEIVRTGSLPFIAPDAVTVTDRERYAQVPRFHDERRHDPAPRLNGLTLPRANVMGLMSALHVNMEATSEEHGIHLLNRSLMLSPYFVALGANASHLDGKPTGMADVRMRAWELTHDMRAPHEQEAGVETRVGLPIAYFRDADDYFRRCAAHPFIFDEPDHALAQGIGLLWQDARMKFINDRPVVEWRALSTQPTREEDIAMALAFRGRLAYSVATGEPLMRMADVRHNRETAMASGMRGTLLHAGVRVPAPYAVCRQLDFATQGLLRLGFALEDACRALAPLYRRVARGMSPADDMAVACTQLSLRDAILQHRM